MNTLLAFVRRSARSGAWYDDYGICQSRYSGKLQSVTGTIFFLMMFFVPLAYIFGGGYVQILEMSCAGVAIAVAAALVVVAVVVYGDVPDEIGRWISRHVLMYIVIASVAYGAGVLK